MKRPCILLCFLPTVHIECYVPVSSQLSATGPLTVHSAVQTIPEAALIHFTNQTFRPWLEMTYGVTKHIELDV